VKTLAPTAVSTLAHAGFEPATQAEAGIAAS
jgi:hypothetical protein